MTFYSIGRAGSARSPLIGQRHIAQKLEQSAAHCVSALFAAARRFAHMATASLPKSRLQRTAVSLNGGVVVVAHPVARSFVPNDRQKHLTPKFLPVLLLLPFAATGPPMR